MLKAPHETLLHVLHELQQLHSGLLFLQLYRKFCDSSFTSLYNDHILRITWTLATAVGVLSVWFVSLQVQASRQIAVHR